MMDLYLRTDTEEVMTAVLEAAGLDTDDRALISHIGTISRVIGYDGGEPVIGTLPGYHANLRLVFEPTGAQMASLAGAIVKPPPAMPFRVWA